MDLIANKTRFNVVNDNTLWHKSVNGHPGYDHLLGFNTIHEPNKHRYMSEGDSEDAATARIMGPTNYIKKRMRQGRTQVEARHDYTHLDWGTVAAPNAPPNPALAPYGAVGAVGGMINVINPHSNTYGNDFYGWGGYNHMPRDYFIQQYLQNYPQYIQIGWIGHPNNIVTENLGAGGGGGGGP